MSQENVEVVRGCLEAFRRGDYEAAMNALDLRIEYDLTHFPDGQVYRGYDGVREAFRIGLGTWGDYGHETDELIDLGGDEVLALLRESGRGQGSGIEIERPTAALWSLRHGKAVRIRFYAGRAEALEAVGLAPTAPIPAPGDPNAATPEDRRIIELAMPYTMTGVPRVQSLIDAVRYCVRRGVPGAFAECGVWRGGSVLAMILTLQGLARADRDIYLYDTFEGMTEPTEHDVSPYHPPAIEMWEETRGRPWPKLFDPKDFNEQAVRETLQSTGYPEDRLHFIRGPVEETIPGRAPDRLALLRLDTDWYESTRHELLHLYPRLADGGILIVDDYGHWEGARRAVDEYFSEHAQPLLLSRIDHMARIAVKH